jgi:hypothetical protein
MYTWLYLIYNKHLCRKVKEEEQRHLISSAMKVLKDKCHEHNVAGKYRLAYLVKVGDKVSIACSINKFIHWTMLITNTYFDFAATKHHRGRCDADCPRSALEAPRRRSQRKEEDHRFIALLPGQREGMNV